MTTRILATLTGLGFFLVSIFSHAGTVVIVHKDNPISKLNKFEVKQLFLKQNKYFANGRLAVPLDHEVGSATHNKFYKKIANMGAAQWLSYWSKLLFTGKKQPPQPVFDNADVIKLVTSNPKYIAYVDAKNITEQVKIVYALEQ